MRSSLVSPFLLAGMAFGLSGCDKLKDALEDLADGEMCLDTFLEMVGISRDDLGETGDALLEDALAAQEEFLGASIVVDCEAKESMSALSDSSAGVEAPEGSNGEEPRREAETTEVSSSGEVGGAVLDAVQTGSSGGMEVAILLDTTCSMRDDETSVKAAIFDIIDEVKDNDGFIAMASYGDNQGCDSPWYGINPGGLIEANGSSMVADDVKEDLFAGIVRTGGCDWPESLYDGIWETADRLTWKSKNRRIIAITDASPHEVKTDHTAGDVEAKLSDLGISLDTILVGISY